MWESSSFSLTAVVLPCCVCYMYLLSSLSQSYVFDIRAVRKITEGTEKPVYPSDQRGKSSWLQWLTARGGWHKASLLGEMSSAAAEIDLNCWWREMLEEHSWWREAQPRGNQPLSHFGYFLAWRCCLGMGKLRQCSGAEQFRQLWAVQGQRGKKLPPMGQFRSWINIFISWESAQACGFHRFFCPFYCGLFCADSF